MSSTGVELSNVQANTINIRGVVVGPSVEELVAALEARGLLQASELAGLQRKTIISLARRLKPDVLEFEQAVTELERAVAIALDVIARGERGTNEDAFVNAVLAQVASKVRNDDFDGGASAIDQALAELDAKHRRSQVALLEEGVKVDILRHDAAAVARRLEMIVAADHPNGRPTWHANFRTRFDEFNAEGRDKGTNFSLSVAIELARRMLATARDADERGFALDLLGNVLSIIGERENDTAHLEEAVAAYREALTERIRERVPLDWAATQNNLGNALKALGERESGTARLEQAVAAFREALKEISRGREPLDWATTQNNLGVVLSRLGERENGMARLEEAVAAYRDALTERTRGRAPLDWAATQNNLAFALWRLGEREPGIARLEQAVAAYREALTERTRERVPFDWAATQNNLGNALKALGERESGTARLEEAVAAYRGTLREYTRERVPLLWATAQNNLGTALWRLGERENSTARLEEAVTAFRDALKECTRERVPLEWAMTQANLGAVLSGLGKRENSTARIEEAVTAFRDALKECTRECAPLQWAGTQNNLGAALSRLGQSERSTALLEAAIAAYGDALKEYTRGRVPLEWAMTTFNQGMAMRILAEQLIIGNEPAHSMAPQINRSHLALAKRALTQIAAAFETFRDAHHAPNAARCEEQLRAVQNLVEFLTLAITPGETATSPAPLPRRGKVGRNDPCPCGSGKKYKRCCGRT